MEEQERMLSPLPAKNGSEPDTEAGWEFDIIPVEFKTGPQVLSGGWEPMQLVNGPGHDDVFLLTKRRIG